MSRVPEEIAVRMKLLRDQKLTLEEIQRRVEEATGHSYSLNAISRAIRRTGERRYSVLLNAKEETALKEAYGSVGSGMRAAVKAAALERMQPENPEVTFAYRLLLKAAKVAVNNRLSFKDACEVLQSGISGLTFDRACYLMGMVQREGFLSRDRDGFFVVRESRRTQMDPTVAIATIFGGRT